MKRIYFIAVIALLAAGCTAGDIEKTMQEYDARIAELEREVEELTVTLSDGSTVPGCTCSGHPEIAGHLVSIQEFGVLPTNTAEQNTAALQAAIDEAGKSGLALYVTPTENGYPMNGGLQLRRNVTLVGAQGPTGRGTANADRSGPTGSVFVIRDKENVFMTVTSATRVEGIQFYYPDQAWRSEDANKITFGTHRRIIESPAKFEYYRMRKDLKGVKNALDVIGIEIFDKVVFLPSRLI